MMPLFRVQSWGLFEAKQGDFAEARRLFSRGLALDPRDGRLLQTWAKQEARRGCPAGKEKATELYQRCLELDRKDAAAWQVTPRTTAIAHSGAAAAAPLPPCPLCWCLLCCGWP